MENWVPRLQGNCNFKTQHVTSNDVEIFEFSVTDVVSDVQEVTINGELLQINSTLDRYLYWINLNKDGIHPIEISVSDTLGNTQTSLFTINKTTRISSFFGRIWISIKSFFGFR